MHYQPLKTKQKSQLGINTAIALMVLFIISVIGVTLYYFLKPSPIYDKQTFCPVVDGVISPKNNIAILIDETDPLSGNQKDFLNVEIERIVYQQPVGTLVSIYTISEESPIQRNPSFCLCKVKDGNNANKLTENERLLNRKFEKNFIFPLKKQLNKLDEIVDPAKESRLFEQIQAISVNSFLKYPSDGYKELYIFSDMLHNSKEYSLYSSRQKFEDLKKNNYFSEIRSNLRGVDVNIYYFANQPKFQTNKNVMFWEKYFNELGAAVVKVEPVGK